MSSNLHEVIIRLRDEATKSLEGIRNATDKALSSIERHSQWIQAVGVAAGAAFAGFSVGLKRSVDESAKLENAMMGLESIVNATGGSFEKTKSKVQEFTKDGLLGIDEASTALKNLLSRGYEEDEALAVIARLKDAAAYGRQAGLWLGEAVVTATEGLKNENSVLVDNAGVTKNVAKMWEEYAKSIGKSSKNLTDQEKIQAEIQGIMKETAFQVGDAEKISKTYSGTVSRLNSSISTMFATMGETIKPVLNDFLKWIEPIVSKITSWIQINPQLAGNIALVATAITGIVAALAGFSLVLPSIISGVKLLSTIIASVASPIGLVVAAITALGVAYTTNFLGFRDIVDSVFGRVQEIISAFGEWIGGFWQQHSEGIIQSATALWETVSQIFSSAFETLQQTISSGLEAIRVFWEVHWTTITTILNALWEGIKAITSFAMDALMAAIKLGLDLINGTIQVFIGVFTGDWQMAWNGAKTIVVGVWEAIKSVVVSAGQVLNEWIKNVFGVDLAEVFSTVWNAAAEVVSGAMQAMDSFVRPILEGLMSFIEWLIGGIEKAWNAAKEVKKWVNQQGAKFVDNFSIQGVYGALTGKPNTTMQDLQARASGGPVYAGQQYMVGERGPELFVPNTNGTIVPNNSLGGNTININLGGVSVRNDQDINTLTQKIEEIFTNKAKLYKLWIN